MIRRLTVLALTGVLLGVAPVARADIIPDPATWITAQGAAIDWGSSNDFWSRTATVTADGAITGHPGNRHTATVTAVPTSGGPRPGQLFLTISLSLRDENCTASGCSTIRAGTGTLPNSTDIPTPAADGSVRLQAPVPASVFTTTEPAGAPVPLSDTTLDVVLTPQNWSDPRAHNTLTSQNGNRYASTASAGGGDTVSVDSNYEGTGMAASGVIAGVPASAVYDGSWRDQGGASGSAGPGLPPVNTLADARPYLPAVRHGRVNHQSYGAAFWDGEVSGRAPLRTSTGHRLPGNAWRVSLYSQVLLDPGDPVAGRRTDSSVNLGLENKQCSPGQAFDDCAAVPGPLVYPGTPASYRYSISFGRSIKYRFTVPILEEQPDGTAQSIGNLSVRATLKVNGPGDGNWYGWLVRGTQNTWQFTATLRSPVTGAMSVGGRPLLPPTSSNIRNIEFATLASGTL